MEASLYEHIINII